jgi:hypothetical protein
LIRPVDLGICHGYEYDGDPARTAVLLPGRMLAGMPANAFAQQGLTFVDAVCRVRSRTHRLNRPRLLCEAH